MIRRSVEHPGSIPSTVKEQAERMTSRVKIGSHIVLGLKICQRCARSYYVCCSSIEIVRPDVQVEHHLLIVGANGPVWSNVCRIGLKQQARPSVWRT